LPDSRFPIRVGPETSHLYAPSGFFFLLIGDGNCFFAPIPSPRSGLASISCPPVPSRFYVRLWVQISPFQKDFSPGKERLPVMRWHPGIRPLLVFSATSPPFLPFIESFEDHQCTFPRGIFFSFFFPRHGVFWNFAQCPFLSHWMEVCFSE